MISTRPIQVAAGATIALLASGCGGLSEAIDTVADQSTSVAYGCDELADEAVRISEEGDGFLTLLKVRDPETVEDNRETYTLPSGDDEELILKCEGTGVWSSGDKSPVSLKWTVDADGDEWVLYKPMG